MLDFFITNQLVWFGQSILLGIFLGITYDIFRILRSSIKHNTTIVFIEDMIFFLICSVATFYFMMNVSMGQIRIFILIGELIGAILYKITIGNFITKFIVSVINLIKKTIVCLYKMLIKPIIKLILYILKPIIKFVLKYSKKIICLLKSWLHLMYNLFISSLLRNSTKESKNYECKK